MSISPARTTAATTSTLAPLTLSSALRLRRNGIAKQVDEATKQASPNDCKVDDLYKITSQNRVFILGGLLNKKNNRPRTSWIQNHGWFLTELKPRTHKIKGDVWCCRHCDNKGTAVFLNVQSTSSTQGHLDRSEIPLLYNYT